MSYLRLNIEESPRYEGAPSTSPYRVSTVNFDLPITSGVIAPSPTWLDRSDELRAIEGFPAHLVDGFEPQGTLEMRAYANALACLLTVSGWQGTVTAGDGVNEVQTITITGSPTGGTFTLTFQAQTTSPIPYNATPAQVEAALSALSTIGAGNVSCSGTALPSGSIAVTFVRALGATDVTPMTANSSGLTGGTSPTVNVAQTTAGVVPTVKDPDQEDVAVGAYKWVFHKRGGYQAKSMRVTAGYTPESMFLRGSGFGVASLELTAAGELSADMIGLVVERIADPSITPMFDSAAIPPARRGDLVLSWLENSATSDDFSITIENPLNAVKTLESGGLFPNVLEHGDTPVLVTGSCPKRNFAASDYDALVAGTVFDAVAKWKLPTYVGTSRSKYGIWIEMPACQYTEMDPDELGNRRRFGASFNWRASYDETAGYDCRITLVCSVSAIETYS